MSHRLDYYFRQRVSESELDLGFSQLEQADHDLAAALGFTGVITNAVVSQHAPVPDLTVDVSAPGAILDQLGQRIFFSALQNVNVAQDDNGVSTGVSGPGKEKVVTVFAKFDRALSDPRVDGNSLTVFFRRDESFKFLVVQGAEANAGTAVPPPLRSDAILLADITRSFGQTQVLVGNISIARRQDAFVLNGSPRSIRRGRTIEGLSDLLTFYNAHANGSADRHPASAVDYAGGGTWADGTTNPAATVEAQIDKLVADLTATSGAPKVGAAATAGAPNSLGAGTVKSQLDALLGFINTHINNPSGAHAASATTYAGGNAWADGTTNPASTVEGQLDKIINDLSGSGGSAKIGASIANTWADGSGLSSGRLDLAVGEIVTDIGTTATGADGANRVGLAPITGAPNTIAAATTVRGALSVLLTELNNHENAASGAHAGSAISYAGGGNWADGTTNPATTVEAQLDKLVADLAATGGAARVGAAASGSIPAGTVRSQLDFVMTNAGASPNAANTWTQPQTFNGAAGDLSPALKTTSGPGVRKLLWEIEGNTYDIRFYSTNRTLEMTLNARWDGANWVKDNTGWWSIKFEVNNYEFRYLVHSNADPWFSDSTWHGNIGFQANGNAATGLDSNGEAYGPYGTVSYIAAQAGAPAGFRNIGGGTNYRKRMPGTPSSHSFSNIITHNLSSGPFSFAESAYGTGAFASINDTNQAGYFYSTVYSS